MEFKDGKASTNPIDVLPANKRNKILDDSILCIKKEKTNGSNYQKKQQKKQTSNREDSDSDSTTKNTKTKQKKETTSEKL